MTGSEIPARAGETAGPISNGCNHELHKTAAYRQLEALADELSRRGFATSVTGAGMHHHHPCVRVTNTHLARMSEDVYAAPDRNGQWAFWWSWADKIGPIERIEPAAVAIAYVLSPSPGPVCA